MTRINSSINVKRLTDEHLLAEHREIKRLPSAYLKRKESNKGFDDIPSKFTLGEGHVNFFLDKYKFTLFRYFSIRAECLSRGFMVADYSSGWTNVVGHEFWKDYKPTEAENKLLTFRIAQRLMNSPKPFWHYHGQQITKQQAVRLLLYGTYEPRKRNRKAVSGT